MGLAGTSDSRRTRAVSPPFLPSYTYCPAYFLSAPINAPSFREIVFGTGLAKSRLLDSKRCGKIIRTRLEMCHRGSYSPLTFYCGSCGHTMTISTVFSGEEVMGDDRNTARRSFNPLAVVCSSDTVHCRRIYRSHERTRVSIAQNFDVVFKHWTIFGAYACCFLDFLKHSEDIQSNNFLQHHSFERLCEEMWRQDPGT